VYDTNDRNNYDPAGDTSPGKKIEPKLGNTLDYYNDDMSRKAVGRLFAPNDDDESSELPNQYETSSIVQGFGGESESAPASDSQRHSRYSSEDNSPGVDSDDDEYDRPSSRRRRAGAVSQAANQDPLDEDDLGFGLYRRRQPLGAPHREPEPDPVGARRRPRISDDYDERGSRYDTEPPARPKKEYKKIEPEREFDSQKSDPYPPRRQKPSSSRPSARKPRFAVRREDEDDDDMHGSPHERGTPMRLIFAGVSIFLGVVVLAIVVFQLISLNQRLSEATAEADVSSERLRRVNELTIENDRLTGDLNSANAEIARLESLMQVAPPGQGTAADEPAGPTPPSRTHTVAPGQTLGQIAEIFYGSAGQWERIAQANNMRAPYHPQIGQVLVIPD